MESYLKDALNQSEKVNFRYFIKLAIQKEITWNALEDLLNDLTPTLIKSKHLNKALLKELQNQSLGQDEFEATKFEKETLSSEIDGDLDRIDEKSDVLAYESQVETQKSLEEESSENEGLEGYSNEIEDTDFELKGLSNESIEDCKDPILTQNQPKNVKAKARKLLSKKEFTFLKCSYCVKYFSEKAMLKRHEKIHTGEKPYQCASCLKCFSQFSHLKTHEKTHTGEKPFQCKTCFKSFPQKGHLKGHEITHTDEKPFECTICGKCFNVSGGLKRHKQIHFR